jgi:DNA-binding beta-propeller fold protein YncE
MITSRPIATALAALALLATIAAAAPAASDTHFKVTHRIAVGGEGGWDCLTMDGPSHRLYLSHGARAVVVDVRTDSIVGEIAPTPGIHDIAIAPDLGRGWTSNGRDSSVTVFDSKSLATLANVKLAARNPDVIVYDPASARVFAFNGGSANAVAIDARTNAVSGTIALGGKPEFAVTDGAGRMWVNLEDSSAIVMFDTKKLQVLARWPIAPGEEPSGLALDRAHHRLFAACGNKTLVVVNAENGHVVTSLPIGQGVDGVVFDAKHALVLTPNGEGTMTVIQQDSADRYHVVENAATEKGARTMALDETTGTAYLPTADFGQAPAPTAERPHPRAPMVPGTFRVLVVQR